jgi:hypothetical protein
MLQGIVDPDSEWRVHPPIWDTLRYILLSRCGQKLVVGNFYESEIDVDRICGNLSPGGSIIPMSQRSFERNTKASVRNYIQSLPRELFEQIFDDVSLYHSSAPVSVG